MDLNKYEQVKWVWELVKNKAKIRTVIQGNFRARSKRKAITPKREFPHDSALGTYIVEKCGYLCEPWSHEGLNKGPTSDEYEEESYDASKLQEFMGKFSVITPVDDDETLGVVHSSHRTGIHTRHHQGPITLVRIPEECMIIFHAQLWHYGDRSHLGSCRMKSNIRAFSYMRVKGFVIPQDMDTDAANQVYDGWCKESCDDCRPVHETMLADNSRFDGNVWKTNKNREDIKSMFPGSYLMGDLATLGWVVIKAKILEVKNIEGWVSDMTKLVGSDANFRKWATIQDKDTAIQYPHFVDTSPSEGLYKSISGDRKQAWPRLNKRNLSTYRSISQWFKENLQVEGNYIKWNTTIEAKGSNFLSNDGAVQEQQIHIDYEKYYKAKEFGPHVTGLISEMVQV